MNAYSACHARPCAGHPDRRRSSDRDGRDKPGHDKGRKRNGFYSLFATRPSHATVPATT